MIGGGMREQCTPVKRDMWMQTDRMLLKSKCFSAGLPNIASSDLYNYRNPSSPPPQHIGRRATQGTFLDEG